MELNSLENSWKTQYKNPIIIAGPCSAESESQMLETAERIKNSGANIPIFRAGIWKPRTKPNGFEGVGVIGLGWLQKVKEIYGFQTATEVANAHHVEAALKADVDILWIGARSTVNPFTIQDSGAKAGVVLNPSTPVLMLEDIIEMVDLVLLMSVNPGFGGQKFIKNTYKKIAETKDLILSNNSTALIQIDGGVNLDNAAKLFDAGADVLVAGNAVFSSEDPARTIELLKI
jgi:hypothetical protein